jgi:UDP-4-amino-4,6-dideoxy-N-acetyl-beta-L-altrosamine transaminase
VKYIPYSCQSITPEDVDAVTTVLRSEYLTQGPVIPAFEQAFSALQQIPHGVAVSNATAGLHIACLALGVGPGSSVWTSPNSFLASANCALYCGATVDFVDIDPTTRNMSVPLLAQKLEAAQRSGELPHVVIPVDFSGLPCELREIRQLADRYGFKILQDASHATGARYLGRPAGSEHADVAVFSFHAVKIVTTAEGGLIATRDPALARRMRLLRSHGTSREADDLEHRTEGAWYYEQHFLGYNYRMTELQAALGLSQLKRLPEMHARRKALAARYDELLTPLPVIRPVSLPDRESAWHLYAIEIDDTRTPVTRREVFDKLRSADIGVNVHYIPIHTQPYYRRLGFRCGSFPNSERYYRRALSIPLYPALSESDQDRVIGALRSALEG